VWGTAFAERTVICISEAMAPCSRACVVDVKYQRIGGPFCRGEADLFNAKGAWKNKIYGRVARSPIWIVAKTEGFPRGSHEDIFRLSDPPYFTASSNPFLKSL
jgi:hypothetical protein